MFVNFELSSPERLPPPPEPMDHLLIADGIRSAIDPGKGLIEGGDSAAIDLRFRDVAEDAAWLEIALVLGAGDWLACDRYAVRLRASAGPEMEIRPALRAHLPEEGFHDVFARETMTLSTRTETNGFEITVPAWLIGKAHAMDLHLFLPPKNGEIRIHDLAVTALDGHGTGMTAR
ncbi:hypothetical protein [Chachezhania antarctica]|uniref:hypothetical protein n=1 Tax=Chachezhania antarctica TaxID=2340860 RepID=UPI000EAC0E82|nr:hypothetical protein [Chachezhania antarctica]|tara:strand:- start:9727 stop:10251 length:525 start_codon:yes stop_codon:yes gene_type:complete